jgi:hypothetical protein
MRMRLIVLALSVSLLALAKGGDVVSIKINGKGVDDLSLGLYNKPGGYKAPPKVSYKRAKLQELSVTAPTDGLDGPTDSLTVKLTGYSGAIGYYKASQNVAPGGTATFPLTEAAAQDFTPNGKQQTLVGRFEVEVIPMKRANVKGAYKGLISIEN